MDFSPFPGNSGGKKAAKQKIKKCCRTTAAISADFIVISTAPFSSINLAA
jgi:hypothetical protein